MVCNVSAWFSGLGKSFEDCNDKSLRKLKTPPNSVWALKGSYPMVSIFEYGY